MKSFCLTIAACLCLQSLYSQTIVGRWGKASEEDLNAIQYTFAPEADALVLFDLGKWMPQDLSTGSARLVHHYHIKILSEEGLRKATQVIRFKKGERIAGLRAQRLWTIDGKKKKQSFPVGNLPDSTLSADSLCKAFTFPEVKVGDILEVRYSLITPSGDVLRPWFFQTDIPTKYSEVSLYAFSPMVFRTQTLPQDFIASSRNKWIRRYSPAITQDPYLLNPNDQRLQVRFQLLPYGSISSKEEWNDLSYALEIGTVTEVEENVLRALGSLATSLTRTAVTEEEKVANIVRHVQKYLRWNGTYSTSVSDDPGTIYRNRTGNSTDINMLMFLLLESAGLSPSRVFISTRDHGQLLKEAFWGQFNHMIVRVQADGQTFLLDATDKTLDYYWLPLNSANRSGWEITDDGNQWVDLPPSQGSQVRHSLDLDLSESGKISGMIHQRYLGYPESQWARTIDVSGFTLDSDDPLGFASTSRPASPVEFTYPVRDIQLQVTNTDSLRLPVDLFGWSQKLPIIASDRSLPVQLSHSLHETIEMQIALPEGWNLLEPLGTKLMIFGEGLSLTIMARQEGQTLEIDWTYSQDEYSFSPSLNGDLSQFFLEARTRLHSELVLVKDEGS